MEQLFKIGDIVTLKSGGEKMTIVKDKTITDLTIGNVFGEEYECSWFEDKKLQFETFHQDALSKA